MNINALLTLALHPETGEAESVAAMRRILAKPEERAELAERVSATTSRSDVVAERYRAELERALSTIRQLRRDLNTAMSAAQNAANEAGALAGRATAGDSPADQRRYRRGPRPVVECDVDTTCADCGAPISAGDPVRVYPGGRVYGTTCHGRRRAS